MDVVLLFATVGLDLDLSCDFSDEDFLVTAGDEVGNDDVADNPPFLPVFALPSSALLVTLPRFKLIFNLVPPPS